MGTCSVCPDSLGGHAQYCHKPFSMALIKPRSSQTILHSHTNNTCHTTRQVPGQTYGSDQAKEPTIPGAKAALRFVPRIVCCVPAPMPTSRVWGLRDFFNHWEGHSRTSVSAAKRTGFVKKRAKRPGSMQRLFSTYFTRITSLTIDFWD